MAKEKEDKKALYYQELADSVIDIIEASADNKSWERPWALTGGIMPTNGFTGHQYSGNNMMALLAAEIRHGYTSGICITPGQLRNLSKEAGEYVGPEKGERGRHIMIPMVSNKKKDDDPLSDDDEPAKRRMFFRVGSVFFLDQLTERSKEIIREKLGLEDIDPEAKKENNDHFLTRYAKTIGVDVKFGFDRASYIVKQDNIVMPSIDQFESKDEFSSTLAHELYHATGHVSREGRFENHKLENGLRERSMEECRAELCSILVGHILGLSDQTKNNNAQYIKGWAAKAKEDPKTFVQETMGEITPIVDSFVCFMQNRQPKIEWFPKKELWATEGMVLPENALPQALDADAKQSKVESEIQELFDLSEDGEAEIGMKGVSVPILDDLDDLDDDLNMVSFGNNQNFSSSSGFF